MKKILINNKIWFKLIFGIISLIVFSSPIFAGTLTAPGAPSATSYTLDDIYTKLTSNTNATEGNHTLTTSATPAGTFHTLKQIYDAIPTIDPTKLSPTATYMGVTGTLVSLSGGYVKTNQIACYSTAGAVISCTGSGQDAETLKGVSRSYTDNSNGTITDNSTGLMWQKCSAGLSGTTCGTGTATTINWTSSLGYCNALDLAGHTDWRLPSINELRTLLDFGVINPAINTTYFPATQSATYWTSTTYGLTYYDMDAWLVDFSDGYVIGNPKTYIYPVRCVR